MSGSAVIGSSGANRDVMLANFQAQLDRFVQETTQRSSQRFEEFSLSYRDLGSFKNQVGLRASFLQNALSPIPEKPVAAEERLKHLAEYWTFIEKFHTALIHADELRSARAFAQAHTYATAQQMLEEFPECAAQVLCLEKTVSAFTKQISKDLQRLEKLAGFFYDDLRGLGKIDWQMQRLCKILDEGRRLSKVESMRYSRKIGTPIVPKNPVEGVAGAAASSSEEQTGGDAEAVMQITDLFLFELHQQREGYYEEVSRSANEFYDGFSHAFKALGAFNNQLQLRSTELTDGTLMRSSEEELKQQEQEHLFQFWSYKLIYQKALLQMNQLERAIAYLDPVMRKWDPALAIDCPQLRMQYAAIENIAQGRMDLLKATLARFSTLSSSYAAELTGKRFSTDYRMQEFSQLVENKGVAIGYGQWISNSISAAVVGKPQSWDEQSVLDGAQKLMQPLEALLSSAIETE